MSDDATRAAIIVRDARPDERAAVATLTREAYAEYATILAPEAWPELAAAIESGLASTAPAQRLVAELDARVVGSAMLFAADVDAYGHMERAKQLAWPEVRLVSVAPEARGHGVARALMHECVRRARDSGATALGIHTSKSMRAAVALYKSMGFVRSPEQDFQPAGAELVEAYRLSL